jgi:hypothetical protein
MKYLLSSILFVFAILAVSCEHNAEPIVTNVDEVGVKGDAPEYTSDYDKLMNEFAQVVGKAVRGNTNFRGLVKDEAVLQFDGDYDVLVKSIASKKIQPQDPQIRTRSGDEEITVGELLDLYATEDGKTRSGNSSIIEELQEEYPNVQIAVPVHAEEWDPETYTPVVVFLPSDYSDANTIVAPGYDAGGDFVWVDAKNEPDTPVIVVSISERVDEFGNLYVKNGGKFVLYPLGKVEGIDDTPVETPDAPTQLTGIQADSFISLMWSHTGTPAMYYVYRKEVGESTYQKIATIDEANNRSYADFNISASKYYYYYVTAVNRNSYTAVESIASNTIYIQAPTVPAPLSKFEALLSGKDVELRWNNDGDVNSNVKIEYKVPAYQSAYSTLVTQPGTVGNYIYSSDHKGTKIDYKATRINEMGASDEKYDFIYAPYRNSATKSPIYVKHIYFADWDIEGFLAGHPEFYLKVVGTDIAGKTVELQKEINFVFDKRSSLQTFSDMKVHEWSYFADRDWYSSITFYLEEYDASIGKLTFDASAKLNKKLSNMLEVGAGVSAQVEFQDKGEWCGAASIDYFDNPEMKIKFPNYGAEILISEKP